MKFTIHFVDRFRPEEVDMKRIVENPGGVTVLDEGSKDTGTFYPYHRIDRIVVSNE